MAGSTHGRARRASGGEVGREGGGMGTAATLLSVAEDGHGGTAAGGGTAVRHSMAAGGPFAQPGEGSGEPALSPSPGAASSLGAGEWA